MATRKRASKSKKGSKSNKGSSRARKPSRKTSAMPPNGPQPPYGEAIRKAIARGDVQVMRQLAVSTRKWLDDVNAALAELESSIAKA